MNINVHITYSKCKHYNVYVRGLGLRVHSRGRCGVSHGIGKEYLICHLLVMVLLTDASVGAHHQHGKVRAVAGEAENGRFQVLVVSGQIDESDHLGGALTDLLGRPGLAVVHYLKHHQRRQMNYQSCLQKLNAAGSSANIIRIYVPGNEDVRFLM